MPAITISSATVTMIPIDFTDPMGLAGDAGGGAVIDTPSVDRLRKYVQAKELFGGGAIEIGQLNYAIGQLQSLTGANRRIGVSQQILTHWPCGFRDAGQKSCQSLLLTLHNYLGLIRAPWPGSSPSRTR
jgi:hypothetical protein